MAMYKFHLGTQAQYDAAKAAGSLIANDLYFTSDTKLLYKGEDLFSAGVEQVESFPTKGAQGRIYVNATTLEAKIWNGSAWVVISPAVSATLTADTAAGSLITAAGIRAYVAAQTGTAGFVKDVDYDSDAQKITITYADLTTSELLLKDVLTGASYDADTATLTFTKANGEDVTVNTVKENFLSTASYDADTHILTMTLVDGTEVPVDLGELIDVYAGAETSSASVTVTGNEIKADVKISTAEGNKLAVDATGLVVDLSEMEAEIDLKANAADVYAKTETYTKEEVNAELDKKANAADVFTQAEVNAELAKKANVATTYTKTEVDAAVNVKANAADVYTKTETFTKDEINAAVNVKANAADVYAKTETYTQAEVDAAIENAVNVVVSANEWQEI